MSAPGAASAATVSPASTGTTGSAGAELLAEIQPAAFLRPSAPQAPAATATAAAKPAAKPGKYTVKAGDTLSSIASKVYHEAAAWPVLYQANKGQIHYADDISAGEKLTVPAKPAHIPAAPSRLAPAAPAPVTEQAPVAQAAVEQTAPAATYQAAAPAQDATYSGSGSFQSCVIASESGGNSQVMNGSGHYGLYQFSASTWSAYGGNAADFGDASVSEQNQVFDNAIAAGGESNWSAYDGC